MDRQLPDRDSQNERTSSSESASPSQVNQLPDWFGVELARAQMPLFAYIGNLLAGSLDAWDVLQDANRVCCQKAASVKTADEFLPWAYKIARYKVLQHRQRVSRDRLIFSPAVVERLADRAIGVTSEYADRLSALGKCFKKLSDLQRKYFLMRYVDELSVGEIAHRAGRAENAVAAALYRGRSALARCIEVALAAGGLR